MSKQKNHSKKRWKQQRLPQAGMTFGSSSEEESVLDHLYLSPDSDNNNNNRGPKSITDTNQNSLIVQRGSIRGVTEDSETKYRTRIHGDKSDTISSNEKDLLSEKLLKKMQKIEQIRKKGKEPNVSRKNEIGTDNNKKETKELRKKNIILRKKEDLSSKIKEGIGKDLLKKQEFKKKNAPKLKSVSSITKKSKPIFVSKKDKKRNIKSEVSVSNTDTQVSSEQLESKHHDFGLRSKIENCMNQSDSSIELCEQRSSSDLMCRYQEQSFELSKLKVKYNEISLENSSTKQMLENLNMEVNNLRYENSSVKTRNETLAARSLENQNLTRIIESLNKKVKELCKEIEICESRDSEKSRKLLELTKCLHDSKEKESSVSVELEHLKGQLIQKEIEVKKMVYNHKIDEAKDFQIKMIHNELVELKGNIRVLCRIKPEINNCIQILDNETLQLPPIKSKMICPIFNFNRVFRPNCGQNDMFSEVRQLVNSFVDGYNVSLITYGQSGSGKTHTMIGSKDDPGIVTHAIKEIFRLCKQRSTWTFKICLSVLEIYNETIFDLLSTDQTVKPLWKKRTQIHDDGKCIHIKGLSEIEIKHEEEVVQYITISGKSRSSCITAQNNDSSRSHFIVMLRIYGKNNFQNNSSQGVLMLCDLAGSENCASTLCNDSLTESKYISKSLTVLGRVFEALYNKLTVIPFRDSKLTHILKPSLSGDAKFAFIVTVSGKMENINNTLRALNLAKKVAQISLGQPRKNTSNIMKPYSRVELLCQSG